VRRETRLWATGILLSLSLSAPATPAAGQEAYVFVNRGTSTNPEFGGLGGVGVAAAFRIDDWIRVQMGLDRRSTDLFRTGIACVNAVVEWKCSPDGIETENSFSSFSVFVLPSIQPTDLLRLSLGPGVVIGTADSDSEPLSGREAKVFIKKTANAGAAGLIDAQLKPSASLPFVLVVQGELRRIRLVACDPDPTVYSPFCGSDWWSEVKVGIGLRF
jgi:hypothetical protein